MEKEKFRKQYLSDWWIETSKRIKSRDHNTCQICGCNDKPLSVHHLHYGIDGSLEVRDDALITLCENCHAEQKEYREECTSLINEMRETMTDFELYQILSFVNDNFCPKSNMPIQMCSIEGDLRLPDGEIIDCGGNEIEKIHNIRKWRYTARGQRLLEDALWEYYVVKHRKISYNSKEEIEEWVLKTYGKSIGEYIETHKEKALEIEKRVLQHLEHLREEKKNDTIKNEKATTSD